MKQHFARAASQVAVLAGSWWVFLLALLIVVVWAVSGPLFHFSDTWQLVINTGTTIVTFLMVFLIQNSQNRDAQAIQLKLDELIRAVADASNQLIDVEDLSEDELENLKLAYRVERSEPEPAPLGSEPEVLSEPIRSGSELHSLAGGC